MAATVPGNSVTLTDARRGAAQAFLDGVVRRIPAISRALERTHCETVASYVEGLRSARTAALQSGEDLVATVHALALPVLGAQVAEAAARQLTECPSVLTSHHHGVDCFAQSVQSTLAMALAGGDEAAGASEAVVVLACSAVPLNNLTFPRGLIAYLNCDVDVSSPPLRVPLFPDRCKRSVVYSVAGFDATMLMRLRKRVRSLTGAGHLPAALETAINTVIDEDYGCVQALALRTYSEQATVINHRLWQRMAADGRRLPHLVYLALESVVSRLLERDLTDASSLAYAVMFHSELREHVLGLLDGERACWDRGALARRVLASSDEVLPDAATGTVFLWGLDRRHRRVPLSLTTDRSGKMRLVGLSDGGERLEVTFDPASVCKALKDGRLLPSLFLSYLCLALARGINCLGGYYQAEYLPVMQRAVTQALEHTPGSREAAQAVSQATTDSYLSGMQLVCTRNRVGGLVPAGPLEIVAAGGLRAEDLEKMASMRLRDAHLASIVDTVSDAAPDLVQQEDWRVEVAKELDSLLKDDVVVKSVPL